MAKARPLRRKKALLNLFVFAEPGWGKTRLAGTSAELGRVLLMHPPTDHTDAILPKHLDTGNIEEMILRDWDDIWESLDYIRHEGHAYDWLWIDNISILQDHGLDDIWETVIQEKPARRRYGLDKQEYGINFHRLGQHLRHLVGARVTNFGMTAHTAWLPSSSDEDSEEPEEKLMPWVQGRNMSPKFCGYMNMVGYGYRTKKGTRVLSFDNTAEHYGKDGFDAFLPDHKLTNPTVPKIVEAVKKVRPPKPASKARTRSGSRTRKRPSKGRS